MPSDICPGVGLRNRMMTSNVELAANERAAHDHGTHDVYRSKLKRVLDHIYAAPNGLRMQSDFEALAAAEMAGARVLEIGCGTGWNGPRFMKLGAASVDGVDVSSALLERAKQYATDKIHYFLHDI